MKTIFTLVSVWICGMLLSQGVLIGNTPGSPDASAMLEVSSPSQGFLPPRLTTAQRDSIPNPAVGLVIYNLDRDCIEFYTQGFGWYSPCRSVPTVETDTLFQVYAFAAFVGGTVLSDGGATVTQRGLCYATSPSPTTADIVITSGAGPGVFGPLLISVLNPGTTYYLRAFATNVLGTAYGNEISFTTPAASSVVFNTPGQHAWTAPAPFVRVLAVGAGGGGGGYDGPVAGGGGSGAAVYAELQLTAGQVYTVGVGGAGGGANSGCSGPNPLGGSGGINGGGTGGAAGSSGCSGGGGGGGGWSGIMNGSIPLAIAGGGAGGGGSNEGTANNVAAPGGGSQPNGDTGTMQGGNGDNFSGDGGGGGGGGGGYFGGKGQNNLTSNGSASGGANYLAPGVTGTMWNGNVGGIEANGGFGAAPVTVPVAATFGYANDAGAGGAGATVSSGFPGADGRVIILY